MNKAAHRRRSHNHQEFSDRLITHLSPRSAVSEAYRTLRTNIQFGALDRAIKTIMVTSAGPGEGKSTTIANLAIAFAQAGHKSLLIDADLRRPVQHKVFGVDQRRGLSAVLVGKVEVAEAIQSVKAVPGLQVLPSGPLPPNPAEMLGSKQWQGLLQELRESFDFVLIDAPPVIAVADASVLAPQTDGVILVLDAGSVPRQAAQMAKDQLDKVGAKFLGAVLNNVRVEDDYQYYYYYYTSND